MRKLILFITALTVNLSIHCISTSTHAAQEIEAFLMNAKQDLGDVTVLDQQKIQNFFIKSSPYGKLLRNYYIPRDSAVFNFMTQEMRERLYTWNKKDSESNCYWTSHFSLGTISLPERYMDLPEYESLLKEHYTPVASLAESEAGDIVRMKRARGNMELHSVVIVGKVRGSQSMYLVLSKNGPSNGPYLLMDLAQLQTHVYPSAYISGIYRKK
jgi:hypothetical protein